MNLGLEAGNLGFRTRNLGYRKRNLGFNLTCIQIKLQTLPRSEISIRSNILRKFLKSFSKYGTFSPCHSVPNEAPSLTLAKTRICIILP